MTKRHVVGIAWFEPEEYDQLRAMFADGEDLQDTYEEWLADAKKLFDMVSSMGHSVERVAIRLADFPLWCQQKGIPMDSAARSTYASEHVAMKYKQ